MNSVQQNFNSALENLYTVFAKYPFRANMPCCIPHCLDQAELDVLGKKPLPEITAQELRPFAAHLLTTCGEVNDLKFVLPRLFELTVQKQLEYPTCEAVFGKLAAANWLDWQTDEIEAVKMFLGSWWLLELDQAENIETVFSALCCTQSDPRSFLMAWRDLQPASLANFVNQHLTMFALGKGFNAFIPKSVIPSILEFFQEPETRAAFEQAFYKETDTQQLQVLSWAEQVLT